MVRLAPSESEVGALHPAWPAFVIGSRVAGGVSTAQYARGGSYSVQPRAMLDASAPSSSNSSSSGSAGSSSQPSSLPDSKSAHARPGLQINLPRPGAAFVGIGIGGTCYIGGGGSAKAFSLWPFRRRHGSSQPSAKGAGPKKVLIMMSNTGGGHRASAEAIRDAFQEKHGDKYKVDIVDMWKEHTPWPFNKMPDTYAFMVKHSILWRLSYEITQPRFFHVPYLGFVGLFMRAGLNQAFDLYQPDLVVSVHPLMQHIPIGVLKQRIRSGAMPPINFATVVTDFTTCHNTWFHTEATRCFVPTDYCAMLARDNGLEDEQIIQHGLPIRPIFSRPLPHRRALKRRLGLDPGLPAVLLVGGGEGMGALEETVVQLDKQLGDAAQVVVICGRNKQLLDKLRGRPMPRGLHVHACGFVDNIHEWMGACDAIITKAGPGTIAEALISGLPILLNGNIPCQEEGNIPYVIDNGVGTFEVHPPKIAHIMHRWLMGNHEDQHEHKQMAHRSKELGRPEAVYQIMEDLAGLADAPDFSWGPAKQAFNGKGSGLGAAKGSTAKLACLTMA